MSHRDHAPTALSVFMLAFTAAALAATMFFGKAHAYSTGAELVKYCKMIKEENDYLRGFLGELEGAASRNRSRPDTTFHYDGRTVTIDANSVDGILQRFSEIHAQWAEAFKSWEPGDFGNDCVERHRYVVKKLEDILDILGELKQRYE